MVSAGQTTNHRQDAKQHGAIAPRPVPRVLATCLWLAAAGILVGWATLAAVHLRDDYRVTHNQGVWMALAETARHGELYPAIFDGERYAGTRYMPLPILLNAAAARAVGAPLLGGKVVAACLMAALLLLILTSLRRLGCPWPVAAALSATVVATEVGLQAASTIGGDLLAVVLQVGALVAVTYDRRFAATVVAGGLAGLGMASKLTGMWAFLAIATWLVLQQDWRRAASFTATCVATTGFILGIVQLFTSGGLSENLFTFAVAGVQGSGSLLRGPNQVLFNLVEHAFGTVVLFPFALAGVLLYGGWPRLSVVHIALGYALLLLVVIYADVGTGFNQLLDVVVLTTLAVGHLAARASDRALPHGSGVALAVVVAILWAATLDLVRTVLFDLRRTAPAAMAATTTRGAADRVADLVQSGEELLAEDPAIYVALGRRPLVMDPFMVMKLERSDPRRVDPLISWIVERRFDVVILIVPLEDRSFDFWWSDLHFGARVAEALRTSYRREQTAGRFFVYRRRS